MAQHGSPDFERLETLVPQAACEWSSGVSALQNCGFRKTANTCSNPTGLSECVVGKVPARNGLLARLAIGLTYWSLEKPHRTPWAWLESERVQFVGSPAEFAESLVTDFSRLFGVSNKVGSMLVSDILLGVGLKSSFYVEAGTSLLVIDRLVHNLLIRCGAVEAAGKAHAFGSGCYQHGGCRGLLLTAFDGVDASRINDAWPSAVPRIFQHALWRHCAGSEGNVCNGNQIRGDQRCAQRCPAKGNCARLPLSIG